MRPAETSRYQEAEALTRDRRFGDAFPIYQSLAKEGDPNCQVMVGWMYYQGLGVQKDERKALEWFEGAAMLGSKVGAFYCGRFALIAGRYEHGLSWLRKSSDQGFAPSLFWLGLAYVRGLGVPKNVEKGVGYLQRAAKAGNFPAQRELALLMIRGKLGMAKIPVGFLLLPYAIVAALVSGLSAGYSEKLMG
jgi:TPR repeat protein